MMYFLGCFDGFVVVGVSDEERGGDCCFFDCDLGDVEVVGDDGEYYCGEE